MDGTFLDSKGQFDMDRLKQVLTRFKEKGMYFAVASGRGLLSLEKLFEEVRNEIIFIAENTIIGNAPISPSNRFIVFITFSFVDPVDDDIDANTFI